MHTIKRLSVVPFLLLLLVSVPAQAAPQSEATLVSGWLAHSLSVTNNLAQTPKGDTDYATTAYAILGLHAAGVAGDQITASGQALAASGDSFIGTPADAGSKATAIALTILGLKSAGLDPSHFRGSAGPRDLYADLNGTVHEDGSVSDMPSAYGQAFAIMALITAPGGAPAATVSWLQAQPCTDTASPGYGGYGFSPGSCTDVDPDSTALAVLALMSAGVAPDQVTPARTYLLSVQDATGGFVSPFSGANANTSGLALAALKASNPTPVPAADATKITQGETYLKSLVYGCESAIDQMDAVGAMAYDTPSKTASIIPLTGDVRATLAQASAQGLWGLVDKMTVSAGMTFSVVAKATPEIQCANPSATPTAGPDLAPDPPQIPSSGVPGWVWAIGAVLVIAAIMVVRWRLAVHHRKR